MYTFLSILWIVCIILFMPPRSRFWGGEPEPSLFQVIYPAITSKYKRRKNRAKALLIAKNFLKPYKDNFGELCLVNKNCSATYLAGKSIFVLDINSDENGGKRSFNAQNFEVLTIDEIWDILCDEFDYNTTLQDILIRCSGNTSSIKEVYIPGHSKNSREGSQTDKITEEIKTEISYSSQGLVDVNSCTEAELTALPGISVILSKKIIKQREEQGGFKSVDDFIKSLDVKPHFASQLKNLVVANEIKIKTKKQTKSERILDI